MGKITAKRHLNEVLSIRAQECIDPTRFPALENRPQ